jgi:transposase InsO family protein
MAAAVRGGEVAGVIFHSDKGGEYVGDLFTQACDSLGVTQSMGRVGSALDNAGGGELQLDSRARAALPQALRHQKSRPAVKLPVHRRLQPPPPAQQLRRF